MYEGPRYISSDKKKQTHLHPCKDDQIWGTWDGVWSHKNSRFLNNFRHFWLFKKNFRTEINKFENSLPPYEAETTWTLCLLHLYFWELAKIEDQTSGAVDRRSTVHRDNL